MVCRRRTPPPPVFFVTPPPPTKNHRRAAAAGENWPKRRRRLHIRRRRGLAVCHQHRQDNRNKWWWIYHKPWAWSASVWAWCFFNYLIPFGSILCSVYLSSCIEPRLIINAPIYDTNLRCRQPTFCVVLLFRPGPSIIFISLQHW